MKKLLNNICALLSSLIVLALCIYAIHDMQTAEGVGYYFCLKLNAPNRLPFDIAADVIRTLLLLLVLLLPVIATKNRKFHDFAAFLLTFVAFIPSISTAYILGLFISKESYQMYLETEVLTTEFVNHFRILIPFIILLAGVNILIKGKMPGKADWWLMILAFLVILVTIPFPGLYSMASFVASYLFIIVIYRLMKEISDKYWLLHIIFFFTAIYRIITVCQAYSLY